MTPFLMGCYNVFEVVYMPRTARKKSESGIYHVIIRGINRQNIFADDEDRIRFLETLDRYREETGCELYAIA